MKDLPSPARKMFFREASIRSFVIVLALFWTSAASSDPSGEPFQYGPYFNSDNEFSSDAPGEQETDPLRTLMHSIVSISVGVLDDARTARTFGKSRKGTGVVIDTSGLIVTTGDLVAEAKELSVTFHSGEQSSAKLVAYDYHTGLGLIRADTTSPTIAIKLGDSSAMKVDDIAMIIPSSGEQDAVAVKIGKIDNYSGGWEYLIESAFHTYPPSTLFSGAALVSENAELLGIGSLVSIDIDIDPKIRVPGNIFIPVHTLTSVMGSLLVDGRSDNPRKPWIGVDVKKTKRGLAVSAVTQDAPAHKAGLRSGDILAAVNKKKVDSQSGFFEMLWKNHEPGDAVSIMILRGSEYQTFVVDAADYYDWLQKPLSATQFTELVE